MYTVPFENDFGFVSAVFESGSVQLTMCNENLVVLTTIDKLIEVYPVGKLPCKRFL